MGRQKKSWPSCRLLFVAKDIQVLSRKSCFQWERKRNPSGANDQIVLNIRHRRGTLQLATSLEGLKKVTVRQRAETLKTSCRLLFAKKETGKPSRKAPFEVGCNGHGPHKKSEDFQVWTRKRNPRGSCALYWSLLLLDDLSLQEKCSKYPRTIKRHL